MAKLYETINAENWCKGCFALNRDGRAVGMESPGAALWCLAGHLNNLRRCGGARHIAFPLTQAIRALYPERVDRELDIEIIADFNDHEATTLDDVLRVCKMADV